MYKSQTNVWTVYDGSSWVGADADYIAYYLDPRNFLNETDISHLFFVFRKIIYYQKADYQILWIVDVYKRQC